MPSLFSSLPPIAQTTLIAASLAATSNLISQVFEAYNEQRGFSLDTVKFLRFVVFTMLTTPPNYLWQQYLERTFPGYPDAAAGGAGGHEIHDVEKQKVEEGRAGWREGDPAAAAAGSSSSSSGGSKPKLSIKNTFLKWFIDGISVGALVNTALFFALMGILKGQPWGVIAHTVRTETIPLILVGYRVWPWVSIVSFSFVPVERRIVFINFFGLMWGIYMSLVAART